MFHLAGLRWDRQWMVVNSKGRACTQRVEPKLALVEVELPSEAFDEAWEPTQDSFMGISYHNFIYLFIHYFMDWHLCFFFLRVEKEIVFISEKRWKLLQLGRG